MNTEDRDTVRVFYAPPKVERFTPPGTARDLDTLARAYFTAPETRPPGARRYLDRGVGS